jgi:hypothetical protein
MYYRHQPRNVIVDETPTTKKDPYPLPFIDEVLTTKAYSFLDGYLGYHQIFIALDDRYKTAFVIDWEAFIWKVMSFGV